MLVIQLLGRALIVSCLNIKRNRRLTNMVQNRNYRMLIFYRHHDKMKWIINHLSTGEAYVLQNDREKESGMVQLRRLYG